MLLLGCSFLDYLMYISSLFLKRKCDTFFIFREYKNCCFGFFWNSAINMCESKSYKIYVFKLKLNAVQILVHYDFEKKTWKRKFSFEMYFLKHLTLTMNICGFFC